MHEITGQVHWHEPSGFKRAGFGNFDRPKTPYDLFMESHDIPIYRDIGVSKVQNLPLVAWPRLGGRGSYIQLYGTEGKWGSYVVEVPGAGALNPKSICTRKSISSSKAAAQPRCGWKATAGGTRSNGRKVRFSRFPVNAMHRIVNASSAPALLLPAPPRRIDEPHQQCRRDLQLPVSVPRSFLGRRRFLQIQGRHRARPVRGLAMRRTNFIPDIVNCDLPLDNRRSPGCRRIEPFMTGNTFYLWIGQHENGHYSKAHAHTSAAVLICVKGKGYTYTWPENFGLTPWKDGKADQVKRVDYEPVGMVSAAPGGARWFHQHFGASKEPFRLTAWFGPNNPGREPGPPGEKHTDYTAMDIPEGGSAIPYYMEDPFLLQEYAERMKREGAENRMRPEYYERDYRGLRRRNDVCSHTVMRSLTRASRSTEPMSRLPGQARQ